MYDPQKLTIVGNITINGPVLRDFLKKSYYFLTWDENTCSLALEANHSLGGMLLFKIKDVSYAEAKNLAEQLGLKSREDDNSTFWSKWNPVVSINHNSSIEAEELRVEALKLGIPIIIRNVPPSSCYGLSHGQGLCQSDLWSQEHMLEIIRGVASRSKENLETVP
ncbi:MAG TPA: hypothetical protein VJH71_01195 [Candidatus Paceibacterota bacterium]